MLREEAIEYFKLNINNLKRILDKRPGLKGSDLEKEIQACEKAIKALEQEPILDKIRAELMVISGDLETIAIVLGIIDKYKGESVTR